VDWCEVEDEPGMGQHPSLHLFPVVGTTVVADDVDPPDATLDVLFDMLQQVDDVGNARVARRTPRHKASLASSTCGAAKASACDG